MTHLLICLKLKQTNKQKITGKDVKQLELSPVFIGKEKSNSPLRILSVWRFLRKLSMYFLYNSAILL